MVLRLSVSVLTFTLEKCHNRTHFRSQIVYNLPIDIIA